MYKNKAMTMENSSIEFNQHKHKTGKQRKKIPEFVHIGKTTKKN